MGVSTFLVRSEVGVVAVSGVRRLDAAFASSLHGLRSLLRQERSGIEANVAGARKESGVEPPHSKGKAVQFSLKAVRPSGVGRPFDTLLK